MSSEEIKAGDVVYFASAHCQGKALVIGRVYTVLACTVSSVDMYCPACFEKVCEPGTKIVQLDDVPKRFIGSAEYGTEVKYLRKIEPPGESLDEINALYKPDELALRPK